MEPYLPAAATRCKTMQRSNRPPSLTPNQQQDYQVQDCDTCAVWTSFASLQPIFYPSSCRVASSSLCPLSLFWITTYQCGSHQTVQADGTWWNYIKSWTLYMRIDSINQYPSMIMWTEHDVSNISNHDIYIYIFTLHRYRTNKCKAHYSIAYDNITIRFN